MSEKDPEPDIKPDRVNVAGVQTAKRPEVKPRAAA